MSRKWNEYPRLSKNLSEVITELGKVLSVNSLGVKSRGFVTSIRQDNNQVAVLDLGPLQALVWTKEGGRRKLILWRPECGSEGRDSFDRWKETPAAKLLEKRGVRLEYAPHGSLEEITRYGPDKDMRP